MKRPAAFLFAVGGVLVSIAPYPVAGRIGTIHAPLAGVVVCSALTLVLFVPIQVWSLWSVLSGRIASRRIAIAAITVCPGMSALVQTVAFLSESVGYRGSAPVTTALVICLVGGIAGAAASAVTHALAVPRA